MNLAPIVLFVFNRPWHTRQTVEALEKNKLAKLSDLIIYSDATNSGHLSTEIIEVRRYIKTITSFKSVTIIERHKNWGLADSIIDGVTSVVNDYGKVIVLEDDLTTSPFFLMYMNDALNYYSNTDKVMHISGYMYPVTTDGFPETLFYRNPSCWGWGTWARAWVHFEKNLVTVTNKFSLTDKHQFNLDGVHNSWSQIDRNQQKQIDTWAIFWYASIFLYGGLCLYPKRSLTNNIGHDGTGTNCRFSECYTANLADQRVVGFKNDIVENQLLVKRLKNYYRRVDPLEWRYQILKGLKRIVSGKTISLTSSIGVNFR